MKKNKKILRIVLMTGFVLYAAFFSDASASGISRSEVINLVNNSRIKEGLPALRENSQLTEAAKAKANDMIKNDYFAHTSPSGKDPWHWLKNIGYKYKLAGENLAINYDNAKDQHSAWMKSASHRKNILNSSYSEIGVAIIEGKINSEKSLVAVQFFGTPIAAIPVRKEEVIKNEPLPVITEKIPQVLSAGKESTQGFQGQETVQVIQNVAPISVLNEAVRLEKMQSSDRFLHFSMLSSVSVISLIFILNMIIIFSEGALRFSKITKKIQVQGNTT